MAWSFTSRTDIPVAAAVRSLFRRRTSWIRERVTALTTKLQWTERAFEDDRNGAVLTDSSNAA